MNRIESVRQYVDQVLQKIEDTGDRRIGYVHIYGVAQNCAMLAFKRNEDTELAVIAGMLQHCLYDPLVPIAEFYKERYEALKLELGFR